LRELRCHYGRRLYRVFYRRSGRLVILLHVFPSVRRRSLRLTSIWPSSGGRTSRLGWTPRTGYHPARPVVTLRRRSTPVWLANLLT
jgi:hypothetical protein